MDITFLMFASLLAALGLSYFLQYIKYIRRTKGFPYPPGPKVRRMVGNIVPLLSGERRKLLCEYHEQYGDIVHLHGLGVNIISLNSLQVIEDLLVARSNINSHRPVFTVVGELMGLDQSTPLLSYGPEWRVHRRLSHTVLRGSSVKLYNGLQESLASLLCANLLDEPDQFFNSVRLYATRVILAITYGLDVHTADDGYVKLAHETMNIVSRSTIPGAFLCDFFPSMKYLPSWLNLNFQKEVKIGRHMIEALVTLPYDHVKRDMLAGNATPSLTRDLLLSEDPNAASDHLVKWTAGSLYGAGGESTYSTIIIFILAMVLNPEKQKIARNEIDKVIGTRLPLVSDMPELPYICAAIKESMRWQPLAPLSIARRTAQDNFYNGFFIPEGTILIPNVWNIAHQSDNQYDPQKFLPERFLDEASNAVDPARWAFGFGRRLCPGRDLAQSSVFIAATMIIKCFELSTIEDNQIVPEFEEHLVRYPKPFRCRIKPRSEDYVNLIISKAVNSSR